MKSKLAPTRVTYRFASLAKVTIVRLVLMVTGEDWAYGDDASK